MEAALRALLAGSRAAGELLVRYQPVVKATDGEPLAVEALVRWRRPDGSMVPPDLFIGTVERLGLGGELDELVLTEALRQMTRWDAAGIRVHRVGVNLGRTSVLRDDLADVVARACATAGSTPDRLVLEVLEHERLHLDDGALMRLQGLVDAGVTLGVDDFGVGYSGVGRLAQLPVGLVKLDRSLLPGAGTSRARSAPDAELLITAVTAMARQTGADVTAEGVETPEQRAVCLRAGVGTIQGWLFAPAIDGDAVLDYWRAWSPASGRCPQSAPVSAQPADGSPLASSSS
ncbi:EAL domain, c-di-GMP-specific phosphodiesterase class I (or its enzymatically inactive variant) [Quadrisphaera granulorum]|uniref:EAL domain-containing protein (Putative c-di-GMP-specific phosphodiesterase class I) n=1 Tax=Quadrisphaera granulorum TaxID=317664 RepID=A0A316A612_9ACTN|nr:EAL domain-containing protein [Quadrisphaera granulorum]PWJ53013.1 EAL domain-containing protein (putative c-di-GMP-specific phosphodiesterase class I) [Quadrisphaera granulorum]SZE97178.1 EAL domain, c-di-GMP-specific phosphodiesterase class I (or its enzymatically inactive variant) [Quadrisphaera granulorum]